MIRKLISYDQSRFWQRLEALATDRNYSGDKEAHDHLKSSVRKVAERAKWISTPVCRYMPQYTLHEERHVLNVLGLMDALVSEEVMNRLTPLECALPILAAYTHDLGMALSEDEHRRLLDESTDQGERFASYCTRFDEEIRQVERWKRLRSELEGKDNDESKRRLTDARLTVESIIAKGLGPLELREPWLKMKQQAEAREPLDGEPDPPRLEPRTRRPRGRLSSHGGLAHRRRDRQQRLRATDNGEGITEKASSSSCRAVKVFIQPGVQGN